MVPSTGQPYCYPTCQVDNGGCRGRCHESQPFCNATDEPCQNLIGCVGPGIFVGMAELKCTLTFIHTYTVSGTRTCPIMDTHTHMHESTCTSYVPIKTQQNADLVLMCMVKIVHVHG